MGVLEAVGMTAISVGLGLLLLWLTCTAFFALLTRGAATQRIAANHIESGPPHAANRPYGP
jgi:hypothetical protein